jgi:hypothetical protein
VKARRHLLLLCSVACAALLPAGSADAAGAPVPSSASMKAGTFAPGGGERLITRRAGEDTLVAAIRRRDGAFLRSRTIRGRWAVAPVTLDGATTGLSANGRVLVLVRPERRYPPTKTRLAVLDARSLAVRREIPFAGFFTLDAVSPDGHWAYLIQYTSEDLLDYRVRALDTATGRIAARDVVDPRSPGEQMGGLPMTRAMSHDGRWAYTLYGGGEEAFIHALDTAGRTAACIDLDMLAPDSDLAGYRLRVSGDGGRIDVRAPDRSLVATVDPRTFAVSEPGQRPEPAAPATRHASTEPSDGSGFPWLALFLVAGLGGACAFGVAVARRRLA